MRTEWSFAGWHPLDAPAHALNAPAHTLDARGRVSQGPEALTPAGCALLGGEFLCMNSRRAAQVLKDLKALRHGVPRASTVCRDV